MLLMTPGPTNVPMRVMKSMLKPMINHKGSEFKALQESIVEGLRYAFQTKGDVFALTSSGTGGVEAAIGNVVSEGDKVIVAVNGVFSERVKDIIGVYGGTPIVINLKWGEAANFRQVKEAADGFNVKAIIVVYNETSTGVTTRDMEAIGRLAEELGAIFIVDAISILGGDELPVDEWKVDICIAGSQKCLACPPGLALTSVSEKAWEAIKGKKGRRPYYFDLIKCKDYQGRGETPYTPSIPLFYALDEALKMLKEEGLEERIKRHRTCAEAFYNSMEALGLKPFPNKYFRSNTVIAVNNPPGISDKDIKEVMKVKHRVVIAGGIGRLRGSIFRIGCMGAVSKIDVITTVDALESSLLDLGYKVEHGAGVEAALKTFTRLASNGETLFPPP